MPKQKANLGVHFQEKHKYILEKKNSDAFFQLIERFLSGYDIYFPENYLSGINSIWQSIAYRNEGQIGSELISKLNSEVKKGFSLKTLNDKERVILKNREWFYFDYPVNNKLYSNSKFKLMLPIHQNRTSLSIRVRNDVQFNNSNKDYLDAILTYKNDLKTGTRVEHNIEFGIRNSRAYIKDVIKPFFKIYFKPLYMFPTDKSIMTEVSYNYNETSDTAKLKDLNRRISKDLIALYKKEKNRIIKPRSYQNILDDECLVCLEQLVSFMILSIRFDLSIENENKIELTRDLIYNIETDEILSSRHLKEKLEEVNIRIVSRSVTGSSRGEYTENSKRLFDSLNMVLSSNYVEIEKASKYDRVIDLCEKTL